MGIDPNEPIKYVYLNMDTNSFCTESELYEHMRHRPGSKVCAVPSNQFAQCLIAGGKGDFTPESAALCASVLLRRAAKEG